MASTISKVNKALAKAGRVQRLVRGGGYYYVTPVSVSSSLYVYKLEEEDLALAMEHVAEVLSNEDGVPFVFGGEK